MELLWVCLRVCRVWYFNGQKWRTLNSQYKFLKDFTFARSDGDISLGKKFNLRYSFSEFDWSLRDKPLHGWFTRFDQVKSGF